MDEKKQQAIKKLDTDLLDYVRRSAQAKSLIESLPDDLPGTLDINPWTMDIDLPYNMNLVRQLRRMLAPDWKPAGKRYTSIDQDTGMLFMRLTNGKDTLRITAHTSKDGSTCHLEQVGTKTIEQTIFKIVCDKTEEKEAA